MARVVIETPSRPLWRHRNACDCWLDPWLQTYSSEIVFTIQKRITPEIDLDFKSGSWNHVLVNKQKRQIWIRFHVNNCETRIRIWSICWHSSILSKGILSNCHFYPSLITHELWIDTTNCFTFPLTLVNRCPPPWNKWICMFHIFTNLESILEYLA